MAKLTQEQLKLACDAYRSQDGAFTGCVRDGLKLAAPHLQYEPAPLDEVLVDRMIRAFYANNNTSNKAMTAVLRVAADALLADPSDEERDFSAYTLVRYRRAKLEKPADPRREKIMPALLYRFTRDLDRAGELADEILAAIDEVKP